MQDLRCSPLQLSPTLEHWWWLRVQTFLSMVRRWALTSHRSRGFDRLTRRDPSSSYLLILLPLKRAKRERNCWIVFVHSSSLKADLRTSSQEFQGISAAPPFRGVGASVYPEARQTGTLRVSKLVENYERQAHAG